MELVPVNELRKNTLVDVRCRDMEGRQFVVEMQMEWSTAFKQRVLFNASKIYVSQGTVGYAYQSLHPVYSLNLVNDVMEKDIPEYRHDYSIVHDKYSDKIIDGLHFTFIELPKFTPQSITEKRMAVLWLRFLTEIDTSTREVPAELMENPEISKALSEVRESAFSEPELLAYDKFWDIISTERTMVEEKYEAGRKKGFEKGFENGLENGLESGRERGREERAFEIARKMLRKGNTVDEIMELTDLSVSDIEKLLKE